MNSEFTLKQYKSMLTRCAKLQLEYPKIVKFELMADSKVESRYPGYAAMLYVVTESGITMYYGKRHNGGKWYNLQVNKPTPLRDFFSYASIMGNSWY